MAALVGWDHETTHHWIEVPVGSNHRPSIDGVRLPRGPAQLVAAGSGNPAFSSPRIIGLDGPRQRISHLLLRKRDSMDILS